MESFVNALARDMIECIVSGLFWINIGEVLLIYELLDCNFLYLYYGV